MEPPENFYFGDDFCSKSGDRVVKLPSGISMKRELLQAYYDNMGLPGYFGFNWDALSDCLLALTWIEERRVVIFHSEVPVLEPAMHGLPDRRITAQLMKFASLAHRADDGGVVC